MPFLTHEQYLRSIHDMTGARINPQTDIRQLAFLHSLVEQAYARGVRDAEDARECGPLERLFGLGSPTVTTTSAASVVRKVWE